MTTRTSPTEALRRAAWDALFDELLAPDPADMPRNNAKTGPSTRADGGTAGKTRPSDTTGRAAD